MQEILPRIPSGATRINKKVSVDRHDSQWTYHINLLPAYVHAPDDHFRFVIAQLVGAGACRPCEIIATFGVNKNKVMRAVIQTHGQLSNWHPHIHALTTYGTITQDLSPCDHAQAGGKVVYRAEKAEFQPFPILGDGKLLTGISRKLPFPSVTPAIPLCSRQAVSLRSARGL